jgi:hypothetical protein
LLAVSILSVFQPSPAFAAASLYVVAPGSATVGDTVTITVRANTNGTLENSVEANFSYTDGVLQGVRGTYSGSVITLPISQPDPSGGSASIGGGNPNGFKGDVLIATIIFTAKSPGTASFGMSGCSVLQADGKGTDDTGPCSGASMTIKGAAAPTPAPTVAPTPQPATPVPAAASTPPPAATAQRKTATPSPKPTQSPKPQEQAATPVPTEAPTPPPVIALPKSSPTPIVTQITPAPSGEPATATQKRTISAAIKDLVDSIRNFNFKTKDTTGLLAILISIIPILILILAIVFFIYRLYIMERRRRRTLDRLFEMELSELAALEGKLDLLAEKGSKGREQYREEFRKSKETILRQLRPDYGKPIEKEASIKTPGQEPAKA